jgi:hypothetical protein
MHHRISLLVLGSVLSLGACSNEDEDEADGGPYEGVVEWRCFEGTSDCWCAGLEPGEEADSSEPRVDACSYTNCYAYEEYGWKCECRPAAFQPADGWVNPMLVPDCPPQ